MRRQVAEYLLLLQRRCVASIFRTGLLIVGISVVAAQIFVQIFSTQQGESVQGPGRKNKAALRVHARPYLISEVNGGVFSDSLIKLVFIAVICFFAQSEVLHI